MNWTRKIIYFFALGFGSGLLPKAPGTWGTIAALPVYFLLMMTPYYLPLTLIFTVIGFYLCDVVVKDSKRTDPPEVVWDEICGYLITMLFVPMTIVNIILGFALFRLFDIWKPWPIQWSEQFFKGGIGVMMDDVIAAIYSMICLQLILFFT